ncbi:MAG TPA: type II toxin-antitoxin system HicA family toxin [Bacteroidia bacterium]|jgi:predicted RNA binding protein YcfA (HicA-like mRNA interferase family)|nr:type II toxin-antitoxin system HicA family toxin [Bacteroidota bacterium]MBP9791249.1 type II toxin-antitoxin system HicA family toxin [Bacteroidia bacterium]MBK7571224.1 type II toxin-antitoxin system HicA family toxin [Bacteroidota bacterium]MBK8584981.1 type II toxin-antitoxin system HicA family toxin [Bacteroidota bacterium]HQV99750.1 type II toxin-antitoxin system HicA family toxin [Bacteroidia bacterium]
MKYNEFLRLLKKDGWYVQRVEGSHHIMAHPIKKGTLTVPIHGSKEIGKGLANKILKAAGLK